MIMTIINIIFNLALGAVLALVVGFLLTWLLNPTATPAEILDYWKKVNRKNRKEGKLF